MAEQPYFEFTRLRKDKHNWGKEGFGVIMSGELARHFYGIGLASDSYRTLQQEGQMILREFFSYTSISKPSYSLIGSKRFSKRTGLLEYCSTPNGCLSLRIDPQQKSLLIDGKPLEVLEYKTMAVNSVNQSMALRQLWEHWFNQMIQLTRQ